MLSYQPKYWRMALRNGFKGGNMFPSCRKNEVAALTYAPIANTDLALFNRKHKPASWKRQKEFSPSSMASFAWDICGGDFLFIRDKEAGGMIVGSGVVKGIAGQKAYRFDSKSPIVSETGEVWKHLIDVDWDPTFSPIPFKEPNAIQNVRQLSHSEIKTLRSGLRKVKQRTTTAKRMSLSEADYVQQIMAGKRIVTPLHRILSNSFCDWLQSEHHTPSVQESNGLDVTFQYRGVSWMAELKVCYGGNTRAAIRAAIGQILEYNHWPSRTPKVSWLILLDVPATRTDEVYVDSLRSLYKLPIFLGWQEANKNFALKL